MITAVNESAKAQVKWLALFVSDVHLNPDMPATTAAFLSFLRDIASQSASLYLLGDLFEYWVGDDDLESPFNLSIAEALKQISSHCRLYWIAGNRDFLLGSSFTTYTGMTSLDDPALIELNGKKLYLSHGDLFCSDDLAYQQFRQQVRQASWQAQFLSQSLSQRKAIAANLRQQSKLAQQNTAASITDANPAACEHLLLNSKADALIHGHTHRPALHQTSAGLRIVLPDWDYDCAEPRGGWLGLDSQGNWHLHRASQAVHSFSL